MKPSNQTDRVEDGIVAALNRIHGPCPYCCFDEPPRVNRLDHDNNRCEFGPDLEAAFRAGLELAAELCESGVPVHKNGHRVATVRDPYVAEAIRALLKGGEGEE